MSVASSGPAPSRGAGAALPAWTSDVPSWFAPAALALAALGGATLLWHPAGLGLTVVSAGVLVAAAASSPRRDRWTLAWWACAVALCAMPTLRAAGWVVALSLLAALALGAVAAGGGTTFRAALRAIVWWMAGTSLGALLVAALAGRRAAGRTGSWMPVARGVALAAPLLIVFGALFAGADAAFADVLDRLFGWLPELTDGVLLRVLIAATIASVAGAFALVAHHPAPPAPPAAPAPVGRTEWIIALGSLAALFGAFVGLQLTVLFGGHDFVARTAGLTYAEYARGGFGELTAVAALTLAVVAASRRWAYRAGARDERLLRALIGVLCLLTLVVLTSALRRLGLYIDAFGQTPSRYFARAEILWLGGVFVLVIAAGAVRSGGWLPRAVVTLTGVAALAFGLSDPDRRIAERNVDRYWATAHIDVQVLDGLSADALPAFQRLPANLRAVVLDCDVLDGGDGLPGFNLARQRLRDRC